MNNTTNVEIYAGDVRTLTFTARDYSNNILNLTGATIIWRMGIPPAYAILQKTGSIVSAAGGTFTIALASDDTLLLRQRDYAHMAQVTVSGVITTAVRGRFRVLQIVQQEVA